jgi:exodeoxyribonuclease-3
MRVITFNANGIRAAARKGFFDWFASQDADVLCIQETKAQEHQLDTGPFYPEGYHCYYFDAQKKGYSGTAIYSRVKPRQVQRGLGWDPVDSEARWLQADFAGLSVVSLYMPSGSSGDPRQQVKYDLMDRLYEHFQTMRRRRRQWLLCADWNICHQPIDLKNWKPNQKNSGFLPDERAWLDRVFERGWVDVFRRINQAEEQYTWWSQRGAARAKNVGWRLDYQLATPGLADQLTAVSIHTADNFSDHAPVIFDYDHEL